MRSINSLVEDIAMTQRDEPTPVSEAFPDDDQEIDILRRYGPDISHTTVVMIWQLERDRNRLREQLAGVVEQAAKVCAKHKDMAMRLGYLEQARTAATCEDQIRSLADLPAPTGEKK